MTIRSIQLPFRFRSLASATAVLACLALVAPLAAQDDKDKEKKPDPEIAEKLDALDEAVKDRKMEHDGEAVRIIDELKERYPDLHERDQKDVLEGISDVILKIRKPRDPDQPALYRTAIFALGTIGPTDEKTQKFCSEYLIKAWDRKPFTEDEWLATREDILENIGRCKSLNPKHIDFLIETATRSPIDGMKRGAGKALRHYADAEGSVRKNIFDKLLKDYATIEGKSKQSLEPGDSVMATATATLKAIRDPWNATLAALSGANHRTAADWFEWWNENKNDRKLWR